MPEPMPQGYIDGLDEPRRGQVRQLHELIGDAVASGGAGAV